MNNPWLPATLAPTARPSASTTTTTPLEVRPIRRSTAPASPEPAAATPRPPARNVRMLMPAMPAASSGDRGREQLVGLREVAAEPGRHLDPRDDAGRDLLGGLLAQHRVGGERQPVRKHRHRERLHVVG